jgi:hypothetical protein
VRIKVITTVQPDGNFLPKDPRDSNEASISQESQKTWGIRKRKINQVWLEAIQLENHPNRLRARANCFTKLVFPAFLAQRARDLSVQVPDCKICP